MCVVLTGNGGGGASTGDLLQRAQRGLQGDGHRVADGLRVVRHRVTGTLGKQTRRAAEEENIGLHGSFFTKVRLLALRRVLLQQ